MSAFSLTPFELSLLMHYAKQGGDRFDSSACYELIAQSHEHLLDAGLIHDEDGYGRYRITDKGLAWLDKALSTPLPVQKWVWE